MTFGFQAVFTAHSGKGEELAGLLMESAQELQMNEQCEVYLIQISANEPDKIYISEVWSDEIAHKASLTNPKVRDVITRAKPLIANMLAQPTKHIGGKFSR